jgi:hypothetical protein
MGNGKGCPPLINDGLPVIVLGGHPPATQTWKGFGLCPRSDGR